MPARRCIWSDVSPKKQTPALPVREGLFVCPRLHEWCFLIHLYTNNGGFERILTGMWIKHYERVKKARKRCAYSKLWKTRVIHSLGIVFNQTLWTNVENRGKNTFFLPFLEKSLWTILGKTVDSLWGMWEKCGKTLHTGVVCIKIRCRKRNAQKTIGPNQGMKNRRSDGLFTGVAG